ncbi:hypothetical protein BCR41DRAFT_423460 [Lobosporangium transversale]|uniref:Tail specific protease domain-containing protein n=1 Tax=Lobosporangium transversale TaxID=64571 RepID=A0A1Y2GIT6_9FUNG|nr:hypothetical protein BCR41DRAFT_423641 [Lobosporangium transversale]XP_021879850.1 hypothetical protein BCR41DRAFT_423460 [Lobosporangium transversale]ORZ10941.1 hypothetical protein BCR41DRAFT_423641 [Lobosporangium transversale]ORZ11753.1 hypothetical protein BCR41DRAFT_423460 [Lobosporangium transversale]|eukprot:XP_021879458.1 hypothetical protein BCR41DRAFT_423641 [Lobosporangium transversale]
MANSHKPVAFALALVSVLCIALTVRSLADISSPPPSPSFESTDPCTILSHLETTEITRRDVAACYKSIEFNPDFANITLDSLQTLFNDFFIFRDSALTPNLTQPFSSEPVDALARIEQIRQTKYFADFDFQEDLIMLAESLNDAHVSYWPTCYTSFIFMQPFTLYAPVVNSKQSIRVFDMSGSDIHDCEVLTINEQDAQSHIQAWADKYTGESKDPGARFNLALGEVYRDPETQNWDMYMMGLFSARNRLPETDDLIYHLRCDSNDNNVNGPKDMKFRVPWLVVDGPTPGTFKDTTSFLENVCYATSQSQLTSEDAPLALRTVNKVYRKAGLKSMESSTRVSARRDAVAVYQLMSRPNVGILAISSLEWEDDEVEVSAIQSYLEMLAQRSVTHIIIDTTGNTGGYISSMTNLVNVFFPSEDKQTNSHPARFRLIAEVSKLAAADLDNPAKVHNDDLFRQPVSLKINDRVAEYTDLFFMAEDYVLPLNNTNNQTLAGRTQHPWLHNAANITILTSGLCGSACGMFSDLLVRQHGVKAVAVGGYHHPRNNNTTGDNGSGRNNTSDYVSEALSMFSYAGGSIITLDELIESFEDLSVLPPPKLMRLPYKGFCSIPFIEIYAGNDTIPLDYSPARHIAAHRLAYTPENAWNRDSLWTAVADTVWAI